MPIQNRMVETYYRLFSKMRFAHISLTLVGLMFVMPFQYFHHQYPLTAFYQEYIAAFLGLIATSLLLTRSYWQQPEIPRVVLLPIGLLLLILIQYLVGRVGYFSVALLAALYLLWMALLIMLGQRLRQELGLPLLATVLAAFLLVGCELAAFTGIVQQYGLSNYVFDRVVALKNAPAVAGNVAQPNHFADFVTLGLISLGLLRMRWQMRVWQVMLLALPLLFVLVLSGSRSVWLFLLSLSAMAYLWQRRDKSCLPLLHYSLLLLLGFGLMHLLVQIPGLTGPSGSVTSAGRLVKEVGGFIGSVSGGTDKAVGSSFRLSIWHEAWLIFMQYPLLGAGFGQFAWHHFLLGPVLRSANVSQIYVNAHNFIIHIAAEMGLAGLSILLSTLVLWFWRARKVTLTIYHWWAYGLFAVPVIHGLFEYPLWYTYFLGMVALAMGMLDTAFFRPALGGAGRVLMAVILVTGVLSMSQMWVGYNKLEELNSYIPPDSQRNDSYEQRMSLQRVQNALLAMPDTQQVYLKPFIEYMLTLVGWDNYADKLALNERVMHYWPAAQVTFREAILLARLGRYAEARDQMERAIWADPDKFPEVLEKLRKLAQIDSEPDRFPALLQFSLQKYEELKRIRAGK